jgi:hypothetical protein
VGKKNRRGKKRKAKPKKERAAGEEPSAPPAPQRSGLPALVLLVIGTIAALGLAASTQFKVYDERNQEDEVYEREKAKNQAPPAGD